MRSAPSGQITSMGGSHYSVHFRALVKNGSGTWVDLSNLAGYNWCKTVDINEDIDQPVAEATVTLWRESEDDSLAPLDTTSTLNTLDDGVTYSPLLNLAREIKIEVATLAGNATPTWASDGVLLFHGYIDRIDWPQTESTVTVVCSDLGAKLRDTFIESEANYGTTAGTDVESIMQSILTAASTSVTLNTPSTPSFVVTTYTQQKESVLDATRTLAMLPGWDVRYKWDSGSSTFKYTFYQPDRAKTTPDHTFDPDFYIDVRQLSMDVSGIRNAGKVFYTNSADGLRASVSPSGTAATAGTASVTKYGRRYFEIEESDQSPIDSSTEAQSLVNAVILDLCEPKATLEVEMLFWWAAELGDLYRFSDNEIHFDSNQDLAVVSIKHSLSVDKHRTFITCRGTPCGAYTGWLEREKRANGEPYTKEPPMMAPRATLSSDKTTADIAVTVTSKVGENVRLHFRENESTTTWSAVSGNGSTTPTFTSSGSVFDASQYFYDNVGSWALKLNDIALTRDQVTRIVLQAEGQKTGLRTSWIPFEINLKGTPYVESVAVAFDESADTFKIVVKGGANIASCIIEIDDDPAFGSLFQTTTQSISDGGTVTFTSNSIAQSDRNKPWYVRVRPFNAAAAGGLEGSAAVDSVRVEGNTSKKIIIHGTDFNPADETTPFNRTGGELLMSGANAGTTYAFYTSLALPAQAGVTITGMTVRGYRANASDICSATLYRPDGTGGETSIASAAHSTTGYQAVAASSFTEDTTGNAYILGCSLRANTALTAAALVWVELTYTSPTPDASV